MIKQHQSEIIRRREVIEGWWRGIKGQWGGIKGQRRDAKR